MLERHFELARHGTTVRRECIAGLTTFLTTSYILVVHPGILAAAGIDREATTTATALVGLFGTLAMGLWARRPFIVAPYMGENAFIAFTVIAALGHTWQSALGAVFLAGALFAVLTIGGLRGWLARAIPASLKYSFVVGIGWFLTFIGLRESGIIVKPLAPGTPPVALGDIARPEVLIAIGTFVAMVALHLFRVRSGILVSIVLATVISWYTGLVELPERFTSTPTLAPIFLELDIPGALRLEFLPVILTIFILDFVDGIGTLVGLSARAGFLDEKGELPGIEKPLLVDSLSTVGAALLGTTASGPFIESATGIEAGGRTGLVAVVAALCFIPALFFAPLLASVPPWAYGPALVFVGMLMFPAVRQIPVELETEAIPAFVTITLMVLTFNIGQGITAGFLVYVLVKTVRGRTREVPGGLWVLAALSAAYYVALGMLGA